MELAISRTFLMGTTEVEALALTTSSMVNSDKNFQQGVDACTMNAENSYICIYLFVYYVFSDQD